MSNDKKMSCNKMENAKLRKITNIRSLNVRYFSAAMLKYMYKLEGKDGNMRANI